MKKQLVYISTGLPVQKGDRTKTFRGEDCTVVGWTAPRNEGSTGRVAVNFGTGWQEFYPSVINAEWREVQPTQE